MRIYKEKLILLICVIVSVLVLTRNASPHGVLGKIIMQKGVLVEAEYDDGEPMSYSSTEIFDSEENLPFQAGRTDRNGRFLFCPDKSGDWKVIVNDGMGHRLALKTHIDKSLALSTINSQQTAKNSNLSRYEKALMGISVIFGISGILFWWMGYKKRGVIFKKRVS